MIIKMSTETLNRTSVVAGEYSQRISSKQDLSPKKVNIDVLKKRVFEEKKKERFQNRVLISMFCLSVVILGYIVV
tara:strand:+ start:2412 stop:2636 length:225 start_codon:yes stop_codon:yes gene_type:complete